MIKNLKTAIVIGMFSTLALSVVGCGKNQSQAEKAKYPDATIIELNDDKASLDGEKIEEYDYTWNCDPSTVHDEIENVPAEYYTGTKPETEAAAYIDHELYYFPLLDESGFKKVRYDGEQEWAYYYNDGENNDYIFATLPNLGQKLPVQMMHSAEDAAKNKVLHITKPGKYVLLGAWNGQIKIDCGDDSFENEEAKVTLVLDGVNIECSVAPGLIFQNVYECDNAWEDTERTDATINTSNAGANVIIADDSENKISGQNVFRMLKTKYKDEESNEEVKTQKKMRKTDGALYSYMTMNIDGEDNGTGKLTVESSFEGIDSELHLNVKGGNITINSQDDGMNVNEDNVSVIAFTGGDVTINAALGAEGDGVDSNGYILVDGGTVSINGIRVPDSALDSEDGIYYKSGNIIIDGEEQTYEPNSVFRETGREGFGGGEFGGRPGEMGDRGPMPDDKGFESGGPGRGMMPPEDFDMKEFKKKISELDDDATFEDVMAILMNR